MKKERKRLLKRLETKVDLILEKQGHGKTGIKEIWGYVVGFVGLAALVYATFIKK